MITYVCICMYVYIYIYTHIHIFIYVFPPPGACRSGHHLHAAAPPRRRYLFVIISIISVSIIIIVRIVINIIALFAKRLRSAVHEQSCFQGGPKTPSDDYSRCHVSPGALRFASEHFNLGPRLKIIPGAQLASL